MAELKHDKYLVFNREQFAEFIKNSFLSLNEGLVDEFIEFSIKDAVVIRRQDQFASPCLLTYATMIAMVAKHYPEEEVRQELQIVADYFHNQGVLAGEEGWKFPTP